MKLTLKNCCIALMMALSPTIFASAYSYPSFLINTPSVKPMQKGDYSFTTNFAYNDSKKNEFDFAMDYALTHQIKVGVTMLRPSQLAGNIHWQFFNGEHFGIAAGILNMTDAKNLSSWDGYPLTQETAFSQYIVTTVPFKNLVLNVGYGTRQFTKNKPGEKNDAGGLFWGVEIPISTFRLVYEFDGKDNNVGLFMPLSKSTEFHVGLTEFLLDQKDNPNYNNTPVRWVTFGFTYKINRYAKTDPESAAIAKAQSELEVLIADVKRTNESLKSELVMYQKSREELEGNLARMRRAAKADTRYIMEEDQKKKDEMRKHYLGLNQEIGEQVISLYYDSFERYYKKEYFKAIELLQKAIVLDPYMPQLYTRLGSVYYELGMKKEAKDAWNKAYSIDPQNEELKGLLKAGF